MATDLLPIRDCGVRLLAPAFRRVNALPYSRCGWQHAIYVQAGRRSAGPMPERCSGKFPRDVVGASQDPRPLRHR